MLYASGVGTWCIGHEYNEYGIKSSDAPLCPSQATGWLFSVGKGDDNPPAIVRVTCSLHKQIIFYLSVNDDFTFL